MLETKPSYIYLNKFLQLFFVYELYTIIRNYWATIDTYFKT